MTIQTRRSTDAKYMIEQNQDGTWALRINNGTTFVKLRDFASVDAAREALQRHLHGNRLLFDADGNQL